MFFSQGPIGSSIGVYSLLVGLGGLETVDVSSEFYNLAEKVRRFLFPVGHSLLRIWVAGSELFPVS